ncbi:MAG: hypothetical protein ACI8XB_003085 [Patiriisocius sp.]|jgi:hypothetical protein
MVAQLCNYSAADSINKLTVKESMMRTFSVYPNPTHDKLFIQMSRFDLSDSWSITNLEGRVIASGPVTKKNFDLEVKDIADGLYILIISGNEGSVMHKIVKK